MSFWSKMPPKTFRIALGVFPKSERHVLCTSGHYVTPSKKFFFCTFFEFLKTYRVFRLNKQRVEKTPSKNESFTKHIGFAARPDSAISGTFCERSEHDAHRCTHFAAKQLL